MDGIRIQYLKRMAMILVGNGGNTEYTRGICELIADVDGIPDVEHAERAIQIAIEIGVSETNAKQMYE